VAIEVGIEITNLFIGDGDTEGTDNMFTAARMENGKLMGDPVVECEIQMGYRAQFPDWTAPNHKNDIEGFYNLSGGELYGKKIIVQILTGYQKSQPPDMITYFQGIIGTMEEGLRWSHSEADLPDYSYGDPDFPKDFTELEAVLYQFITRRFLRSGVSHSVNTEQGFTNAEALDNIAAKNYRQAAFIRDYELYADPGANAFDRFIASLKHLAQPVLATVGIKLPLNKEKIMAVPEANKFGVICILSETLRATPTNVVYGYGLSDAEAAAITKHIPSRPFNYQVDTLGGQLVAIQAHYPFLRWYQLIDGSFYFYHERDTDADLWLDPFIKTMQEENTIPLPAIYDMTAAGTRTIRCPFYAFTSPMTTVLFQNRFMLGSLVSYYYPVKTNAFLVITSAVEFSTTGDENMMEMLCVDLPPGEVDTDPVTGRLFIKKYPVQDLSEAAKLQQGRNLQWTEQRLTVALHKTGAMETDSRWENIVHNDVLNDVRTDRWPEDAVIGEKLALEQLKEWNPDYFDEGKEYMARGNSIENNSTGIGGRTGITVPCLKVGDQIMVRHPFQPEYPDDEQAVV
jgi:hypothetical protein